MAQPFSPPPTTIRAPEDPMDDAAVTVTLSTDDHDPASLAGRLVEIIGTVLDPQSVTVTVRGASLRSAAPRPRPAGATAPPRHMVPVGSGSVPVLIDVPSRRVVCRGLPIELTRLEFDLLLFLCEHRDRVHRRTSLINRLWGASHEPPGNRTVDVHIRRIRAKLGDEAEVISTVRGIGYRVDVDAEVIVRYHSPPAPAHRP
ncbi:winged helix-turn-helix domain-containing protein [Actinoalloteichus hymeniacidonis]|uniref:Transcriptional regulatory protein n=1 Tax=Actinoalloteichus hymeniacidonis TaxID=340345 RepID=A0AAC9HPL6_9PSEU|nr:winged helix-turn-helix domain-containing protein [Actinoalloteichus hymeniacidonis]AOS63252.1 transcriptional regulatory protein [Actinoalloteichus hymeniacidonis]MBB5908709.1 DNA-binding winged helix-turn-helix (wHTH) protein [Actinoalloteichus hymeniacidonis]